MSTPPKENTNAGGDPAREPADTGMRKGLTDYGDRDFSLFLRKAFIKGAGFTGRRARPPVIALADTGSELQPCMATRRSGRGGQAWGDVAGG